MEGLTLNSCRVCGTDKIGYFPSQTVGFSYDQL